MQLITPFDLINKTTYNLKTPKNYTGMQKYVIVAGEPHGVPLKFKFMPQMLAGNLGYKTHAVGKWHLGYHRKVYLPTNRGFDSHVGYWNGMEDYYDHSVMNKKVI